MRAFVELSRPSRWLSISALALMTAAVAGCSSETSRFGENPYASPYSSNDTTGSVAHAPSSRGEAQPLPQAQALPPPPAAHRPATVSSGGSSGGSAGMGSYQPGPASYAAPAAGDVTGSVATPPRPVPAAASKWDWNG